MTNVTDIARFAAADFRYHLTVLSGLVLGFLLLFINDLPPFLREVMLPALVVYTVGTALIGYVQILLTVSENTKAQAEGETPKGIRESHLRRVIWAQLLWFGAFLGILIYRALV